MYLIILRTPLEKHELFFDGPEDSVLFNLKDIESNSLAKWSIIF